MCHATTTFWTFQYFLSITSATIGARPYFRRLRLCWPLGFMPTLGACAVRILAQIGRVDEEASANHSGIRR
ncbi:hypothetical protein B0H10DRAFT_2092538 [Mycena sp. CBHHK59/15]|nr:hypothetical protein B0H10DRAFT_2092538 [Mycena sp. CBHHK59/15]